MNIRGAVVAHGAQVKAAQDVQCLQHHRPLRPGAAAIDIELVEADATGRFDRAAEVGEVVGFDPAAVVTLVAQDRGGDVAPVERVARGVQPGETVAVGVRAFLVRHVLQRASEVALHEHIARRRRFAIGQEYRGGGGPVGKVLHAHGELLGQERIGRETVAREADRGGCDLAERHGAKAGQRGNPDAGRGGDDAVQQALGDTAAVVAVEVLDAGGLGPDANAADHVALIGFGEVDHHRGDAAEADELAFQHVDREAGGDAGIDGVAAGFQDLQAGKRGVVVAGHHDVVARHDVGAMGAGGAGEIARVDHGHDVRQWSERQENAARRSWQCRALLAAPYAGVVRNRCRFVDVIVSLS